MSTLLSLAVAFIGLVPERLLRIFARGLRFIVFDVFRYRRKIIRENLERAFPDKTAGERRQLERGAQAHLALAVFEFFKIPAYAKSHYAGIFEVRGLEHYEAAKKHGKGILCLTGHLGSFELGAGAMAQRLPNEVVWVLVKSFPAALDAFVTRVRQSSNLRVLRGKGALHEIPRALRRNEAVVFVQDQNATRRIGVFVDFFGHPACTMSGLAILALKTGAPVLPVSMWRNDDGTHVVEIFPEIALAPLPSFQDSVRHMTQIYTGFIEAQIRRHPEQWLWSHRRWKTRPDA